MVEFDTESPATCRTKSPETSYITLIPRLLLGENPRVVPLATRRKERGQTGGLSQAVQRFEGSPTTSVGSLCGLYSACGRRQDGDQRVATHRERMGGTESSADPKGERKFLPCERRLKRAASSVKAGPGARVRCAPKRESGSRGDARWHQAAARAGGGASPQLGCGATFDNPGQVPPSSINSSENQQGQIDPP